MVLHKKRLGDVLLEANLITQEQLQLALDIQKTTRERLGKILVDLKILTEKDIALTLSRQLGIPYIDLTKEEIEPFVIDTIPVALAERYKLFPVNIYDNKLLVAMADPLNVVAIDDVQVLTGMLIERGVATESAIDASIRFYYRKGNVADKKLLSELEDTFASAAQESAATALSAKEGADDAPIVRLVNSIIEQAVREGASDIHIEPLEKKLRVRYRIDGILREVLSPPAQAHSAIVSRIKILADLDISEKRLPQDGRIELNIDRQDVDLRISTLPTIFGEKVVIRILNKSTGILRLKELGLQPDVLENYQRMLKHSYGMILVTGPTGSGKTTTLYATLQELNDATRNIVTVEDPVEYQLHGINQVAVNSKIGLTFANVLRSILRQDPNVIMVGEIRDAETAEIAIRSALTGHLVFSTLHTNDAPSAVVRLLDMGLEPFLIASAVRGIIAQRLVRKICERCRETYELPVNAPERFLLGLSSDEQILLYRGRGCSMCHNSGYRGRIAIFEFFPLDSEAREMILQRNSGDQLRSKALEKGMISLQRDGLMKAMAGLTTLNEIIRVAYLD